MMKNKEDITIETYENACDVPDPKSFNSKDKNLIVFDDIMCDKNQDLAGSFYTRGRHNNADVIYISQNYYQLPKKTIRANANFMIFFKLSPDDVDNIFRSSGASVDFKDIDEFRNFCNKAWQNEYGYVVIDKDKKDVKQRYRTQLELNTEPISIMKNPDEPVVFERHVTFEDEIKDTHKPRATKKCGLCDIEMLSSSHAKHIKSKAHIKKTSIN